MTNAFFEKPILNSPYVIPSRHWELDSQGQPTQKIVEMRRRAEFVTPIPKPKKRKGPKQKEMDLGEVEGIEAGKQQVELTAVKRSLKAEINAEAWESLHSDTSRPFAKPKSGRVAVKVINHLGDEVMKVFGVK